MQTNYPRRRALRLKGFDYTTPGGYFVTICTVDRRCLFGDVRYGEVVLNELGQVVDAYWHQLSQRFPIELDVHVVMPNHFHGLLHLRPAARPGLNPALPVSLGEVMRVMKGGSAKRINELRQTPGSKVWQDRYYDHVVRTDRDLARIRRYILDNPATWGEDALHP